MTTSVAPIGHELLDDPDADSALVAESLTHLSRANWWFGGTAAARAGIARVVGGVRRGRPAVGPYMGGGSASGPYPTGGPAVRRYTLLDIGTGSADIPRALVRWGERHGIALTPLGLERNPTAARIANHSIPTLVACACALPIKPRSVDLVLVSQVLHHMARPDAIALLQSCDRVARVGVVIADIQRSAVAQAGFRVAAKLLRFDPATSADGVTSIRRGYTPDALRELLAAAGIAGQVLRRPGWRLVAYWRTEQ